LAHAEELKTFGVTLEEHELVQKVAGATLGAIGLALKVADSLNSGVLRKLVLFLRDIAIPEEEIFRLRLDEPERVSEVLSAGERSKKKFTIKTAEDLIRFFKEQSHEPRGKPV